MIGRVDHEFLRLDRFVLNVHRAQLPADNLHRVRDALGLDFPLRLLLAFDLDLGVLRCSSCVAASLRATASATSPGYCTLPTTTLVMMNGELTY